MYKYKALKVNGRRIDEHRHVMQLHLGRELLSSEIVRHHDGNTRNNAIENLYIINRNEQIYDQIKKGEVSQKIKNSIENKKLGIKRKKWHPKGWGPKSTGRPKKEDSIIFSRRITPVKPLIPVKKEKIFETKIITSKLISLKIDNRTIIYVNENLSESERQKIINKFKRIV